MSPSEFARLLADIASLAEAVRPSPEPQTPVPQAPERQGPPLDPGRTLRELEELKSLTGDEEGAQRVAFTPAWTRSRAWLRERFGVAVQMSGSGSACFALLADDAPVAAIMAAIHEAWGLSAFVRETRIA